MLTSLEMGSPAISVQVRSLKKAQNIGRFAWRADGSLLGFRGNAFVQINLDGSEPSPIDLAQKPVGNGCNGTRVVWRQRGYVNLDTGAMVPTPFESPLVTMLFSTNCSAAAWIKDGVLSVAEARRGAPARELVRLSAGDHFQEDRSSLAWSPDDRFVYFVTYRDMYGDYELWRVPSAGGAPVFTGIKMPDLCQLSMHPDGNRIAFTSVRWNYEAWAIDNLLPRRSGAEAPRR